MPLESSAIGHDVNAFLGAKIPLTHITVLTGLVDAGLFLGATYLLATGISKVRQKLSEALSF